MGDKARARPLRLQIQALKKYFKDKYTKNMAGVIDCEIFLAHFLIDSSYMDELSNNIMSIVRHIGTYAVGMKRCCAFLVRVIMFLSYLASPIE